MRYLVMIFAGLTLLACSDDETSSQSGAGGAASSGGNGSGGMSQGGSGGTANTDGGGGSGGTANVGGSGGGGGSEAAAFTFFATSVGNGTNGGDLGGLAGADAICQSLAEAAGAGNATWRAYLSTSTENARDRIGTGPWANFNGAVIAADVASLHAGGLSNDNPQHIVDETGAVVPNAEHDILTGSDDDGNLFNAGTTCRDWTSNLGNGDGGFDNALDRARVGHSEIPGNFSPSWNNAHTTAGCRAGSIGTPMGTGRLYCFAE